MPRQGEACRQIIYETCRRRNRVSSPGGSWGWAGGQGDVVPASCSRPKNKGVQKTLLLILLHQRQDGTNTLHQVFFLKSLGLFVMFFLWQGRMVTPSLHIIHSYAQGRILSLSLPQKGQASIWDLIPSLRPWTSGNSGLLRVKAVPFRAGIQASNSCPSYCQPPCPIIRRRGFVITGPLPPGQWLTHRAWGMGLSSGSVQSGPSTAQRVS